MKTFIFIFVAFFFFFNINAQTPNEENRLPKVFIAPMKDNFDSFITAALIKRKVPVSIVTNEDLADYLLIGNSITGEHKWYDTIFGDDKDRVQGTLQLLSTSDKSIVWAGSAGDKTYWFRAWRKSGQIKVAQRLADSLRKEFFNKKKN